MSLTPNFSFPRGSVGTRNRARWLVDRYFETHFEQLSQAHLVIGEAVKIKGHLNPSGTLSAEHIEPASNDLEPDITAG